MQKRIICAALCALALLLAPGAVFSQKTEIVLFQINDVYEIAPVEGGRAGGLARAAFLSESGFTGRTDFPGLDGQ